MRSVCGKYVTTELGAITLCNTPSGNTVRSVCGKYATIEGPSLALFNTPSGDRYRAFCLRHSETGTGLLSNTAVQHGHVHSSPQHGLDVCSPPQHGLDVCSSPQHGLAVCSSPQHGLAVCSSPQHGLAVCSSPQHGLAAYPSPQQVEQVRNHGCCQHRMWLSGGVLFVITILFPVGVVPSGSAGIAFL